MSIKRIIEWISVEEGTPDHLESVLIFDPGQDESLQVQEGFYDGKWHFLREGYDPINVTQWASMPHPMKRGENG